MSNIKHIFLFLGIALVVSNSAFSQKTIDSLNLIQLSGVVVSESELNTLPYATIFNKTQGRGVMADYYGYFSLVTLPNDTLFFSYYGYQTTTFIVPDTLKDNRYSVIHMMTKDTINLPEITIYPWPSKEDFARYFVEMNPTEDVIKRAQRELSGESLAFAAARVKTDASLAQSYARNQMYTQIYTKGQIPSNNLLNPFAWSKLINDWKEGKLKRQ
ncbi:MAG: carboxypeptidase-like regulatory domain-containing protein [Crocinitomicaceae bacterium]|nr:carboxypeptidase-like regulatory domain-containing protein [Crocinitomicaceae bacterium]